MMGKWIPMILLLGACAPAAREPLQAPAQMPARIDPRGGGYDVMLNRSERPVGAVFPLPAGRIWPIAVAAYAATGLHVDGSDPAQRLVQTRGQYLRRRFDGHSLSYYFDCGSELAGNIADMWRIKVAARMAVMPAAGDSSQVATMLSVSASPIEGTSTTVTQCSSTGRLEQAIAERVRQALTKS